MKLLALTLLALVACVSASYYPYGPKCFDHSSKKFYDVGANGGFAQRAFLIAHKGVMEKLREKHGFKGCRTADYHLHAGCFEPVLRVDGANLLGDYAFKYGVVLRCPSGWVDCHILAHTEMARNKELLKGKAMIKCE
ncbi:hypothetical protein ABPG77_011050 [Micractinium sp. CCAP 211/92]